MLLSQHSAGKAGMMAQELSVRPAFSISSMHLRTVLLSSALAFASEGSNLILLARCIIQGGCLKQPVQVHVYM